MTTAINGAGLTQPLKPSLTLSLKPSAAKLLANASALHPAPQTRQNKQNLHSQYSQYSQHSPHNVIILAAGLSQRLGEPKQLLTQHGQTLLDKAIAMALSSSPMQVVVVVPQQLSSLVQVVKTAQRHSTKVHIVQNSSPDTGMATSLKLAIDALESMQSTEHYPQYQNSRLDRVLIMGVDQILLDSQHLQALLAGIESVVASEYPSTYQPSFNPSASLSIPTNSSADTSAHKLITGLPLVVDFKLLQTWSSKLSGDKGLRDFIRALPSEQIHRVANPKLSFDIDTPKQLAYAKAMGWLD